MAYLAVIPIKGRQRGRQHDGYNDYDLDRILQSLQREGWTTAEVYRQNGMGSTRTVIDIKKLR